jgi:Fe-S cluster assembly protein SufD
VFARALIIVGDDAKADFVETFLESWAGSADALHEYQTNIANEAYLGSRSHVSYARIQEEGRAALHLSTLLAELGAKANFRLCSLNTGASISRHSVSFCFAGEGGETLLASANLLRGKQHADTTLVIDHMLPGGKSRAVNKSALDDESRGVFQGRIVVRPDAQKTDAKMMTGALLLGEAAEADNKPELEIFADDVQCGHGATAGALDPELLFYLRSRGIPLKEAEALMIESFVGEAFDAIAHEGLREALKARARAWLAARA